MISIVEHRKRHSESCNAILDSISNSITEQVFVVSTYQDDPGEIYMAKFPLDYIDATDDEDDDRQLIIDLDSWEGIVEEIFEDCAPDFATVGIILDSIVGDQYQEKEIPDLLIIASTSLQVDMTVQSLELKVNRRGYKPVGKWIFSDYNPDIIYDLMQVVRSHVVNQG